MEALPTRSVNRQDNVCQQKAPALPGLLRMQLRLAAASCSGSFACLRRNGGVDAALAGPLTIGRSVGQRDSRTLDLIVDTRSIHFRFDSAAGGSRRRLNCGNILTSGDRTRRHDTRIGRSVVLSISLGNRSLQAASQVKASVN